MAALSTLDARLCARRGRYRPRRPGILLAELRDDAQDARDALFSFIRETPGKEAFLALMDISRAHPAEQSRPWIAFHAKEEAKLDADAPP